MLGCAVSDATKNMLIAARIGRETANSPRARLKRANTLRKNTSAQPSWKRSDQPAWLTEEFYITKIQPALSFHCQHPLSRDTSRFRGGTLAASARAIGHIRGIGKRWLSWYALRHNKRFKSGPCQRTSHTPSC